MVPGLHTTTYTRDIIIFQRLILEIHDKMFFSKTARPKACIFGTQDCQVELYINPAIHAPGVKMAPHWESLLDPDLI